MIIYYISQPDRKKFLLQKNIENENITGNLIADKPTDS